MAGLFAIRALRAGREKFDPFGERSSDEDEEEDDLDDVEEPEDDGTVVTAATMTGVKSTWEKHAAERHAADAAFDVSEEAAPSNALTTVQKSPPLQALKSLWETTCELMYEDDDAEVFCVRFNPEDKLLAAGCGDSVVRIFHCDDGRLAYNLEHESTKLRLPTTCLRWRPSESGSGTKNILLAANADGTIQHWHVTSRKCLHTITEENNQVYAIDYSPDGSQFATAGKDYAVRVYDEATKSVATKLCTGWVGAPGAGHSNRVFSLKFVPDEPQLLLSAGWDNTVQIWDLRVNQPIGSMYGPHVCGDSIDARGMEVLTGSWRPSKQLQLWDRRRCEAPVDVPWRPALMEGHGLDACNLYAAQFSKPSASGPQLLVAGGSGANELKVFERASMTPIGRFDLPRGVYGIDMSNDGRSLAVAGGDCKVRVLEVPGASVGSALSAPAPAEPVGLEL